MKTITTRVLLFKENDWWVAQCLEFDLTTQAKTIQDLRHALDHMLKGHILVSQKLGLEPFENVPPAPERYQEAFKKALPLDFKETIVAPDNVRVPINEARVGDLVAA